MAGYTTRTLSMAGGIIGLAALAAYFGLAHSCEPQGGSGTIAGQVLIAPNLAEQVKPTDVLFVIVRRPTPDAPDLAVGDPVVCSWNARSVLLFPSDDAASAGGYVAPPTL